MLGLSIGRVLRLLDVKLHQVVQWDVVTLRRRGESRALGHRDLDGDLHGMTDKLQAEASRAEAAAEADFPPDASATWPNRSCMLKLRLRQPQYDGVELLPYEAR